MIFEDKTISCRDCKEPFVFSAGEQQFFSTKGLVNEPKRCPNCRLVMRLQRSGEDSSRTTEVNCAECGTMTRVPFQPKGYRPVYCTYCFQSKKLETPPESTQESTEEGSLPDGGMQAITV